MHRAVGDRVAEVGVSAVRRLSPDYLPRIQVFNRKLGLVLLLSILNEVALHKQGQVNRLWVIGVSKWCIRSHPLYLLFVGLDESVICSVRYDNNYMSLNFCAFNHSFVHAICPVKLK